MTDDSLLQVGIGEVKVGSRGEFLKATLGSCVGIAVLWKQGGRCGLAHCLLPKAPGAIPGFGARYVNQALPSVLSLMGVKREHYPEVQIVVTGGARMFSVRHVSANVGRLNSDAAQSCLAERGLVPAHIDVGGRHGRQIVIDCSNYVFTINQIARQPEESQHECS